MNSRAHVNSMHPQSADVLWKKSRRRIIAAIMAVLLLLFAGTFATIYGASYKELRDRDLRMLQTYIDNYQTQKSNIVPSDNIAQDNTPRMWKNPMQPKDNRMFNAANFYTVVFQSDGSIYESDNHNSSYIDTDTLIGNARAIVSENKVSGSIGDLVYLVGYKNDYTIVAFMDSALVDNSTYTLLRNTLIFGLIALVALYFVARWLANRIVLPMQKAWEEERRFISDVSHELKTPLAVISTNAEVLSRNIGQNKWLDNIEYEVNAMTSLVHSMMDLTLSESNCSESETINFSKVVDKEVLTFETVAFEQGRNFTTDVVQNIMIDANAAQIAQLVRIIIDNAFSHSKSSCPIDVTLNLSDKFAVLTVTNDITDTQVEEIEMLGIDNLFERFSSASSSRSQSVSSVDTKHSGLGLAIAKSLAINSGGDISAEINNDSSPTFAITVKLPSV